MGKYDLVIAGHKAELETLEAPGVAVVKEGDATITGDDFQAGYLKDEERIAFLKSEIQRLEAENDSYSGTS
ncbi:hypothetical protein LJR030_003629 [Rhizobium sp. LjRoot30]|uniref:hypothetical protein n=1 Tax=Rhizobium sp. LjRoot30 TaxID=3342320 RepID=UPI003ECD75EC